MGGRLERRVAEAAEEALAARSYVSPVDVLTGLRWIHASHVDTWRQGRLAALEDVSPVAADRLADAVAILGEWARRKGLTPSETAYVAASRDRRALRFTSGGDEAVERSFRVHWISPDLGEAGRRRLAERQNKAPDLVVIAPVTEWKCASCGDTGPFLIMENDEPLCLTCADLAHLVFLPSGDAALSRRAKRESGLTAVVMRFNTRRRRYERRGVLVEEAALARAEELCLADEEVRLRRRERDRVRRANEDVEFQAAMAREIVRLFPGCSAERAEAVARHAGERSSGRVGRTAAAKALDENAITLAVVASVRHENTEYDSLLMSGVPRDEARDRIRPTIDAILTAWRLPAGPPRP
jgi:hypothetical protein